MSSITAPTGCTSRFAGWRTLYGHDESEHCETERADRRGRLSVQRGEPLPALSEARRTSGPGRHAVRGLGSQRRGCVSDRRLQRLGPANASAVTSCEFGHLGRLHPRGPSGRHLQVPGSRAGRALSRWQGRTAFGGRREPAPGRIHRLGYGLRVGRRRLDARPVAVQRAGGSLVDLRGPRRLVDASSRGARTLARLSRAGATSGGPRRAPGLHPRGAAADNGAPFLRFVGLSDHWLFRADQPLRHASGLYVPDRLPPPAEDRGDPGLGAVALSKRPSRAWLFRWDPPLRAPGPTPRLSPGLQQLHLQLRPARGAQLPLLQRDVLAGPLPRRRPARRRRRLDALPGLLET